MTRNSGNTHPAVKSRLGTALVIVLYKFGFPMHRIAALFDENPGRVGEILGRKDDRDAADDP